jgi:hypothetical protein
MLRPAREGLRVGVSGRLEGLDRVGLRSLSRAKRRAWSRAGSLDGARPSTAGSSGFGLTREVGTGSTTGFTA